MSTPLYAFFPSNLMRLLIAFSMGIACFTPLNSAHATTLSRFRCTFEAPTANIRGALPMVCSVFGDFLNPSTLSEDNHLNVICGSTVLYADDAIVDFSVANLIQLKTTAPGVATLVLRSQNPGTFIGPLGSTLRLDIPGTPAALMTGVCQVTLPTLE